MEDKKVIPPMPGRGRPAMLSDKLGYPVSVGDYDWDHLRHLYRQVKGGWVRKCNGC